MAIINADQSNFSEMIKEGFVIVDFYGTTCVPCKNFSRILEDLEAEMPFIHVVKLNTTDNPKIARENKVTGVPTVHVYQDGELLEKHLGVMQLEELKEVIGKYLYA